MREPRLMPHRDDANRSDAALSLDSHILTLVHAPSYAQPITGIALLDGRTGKTWTTGPRKRLWEGFAQLRWSPDGTWIAHSRLAEVSASLMEVRAISTLQDVPPVVLGN